MANFLLIFTCVGIGLLFRRLNLVPIDTSKGINTWILNVALPAVSFTYIPQITWSKELLLPLISPLIVLLGSYIFVGIYSKRTVTSNRTKSTLKLATGFSNTSFVGFPLIAAYFGEAALSIAIICDQAMFLFLASVGMIIAMRGNNAREIISAKKVFKKLFTFPPFIACLLALTLSPFLDFSPLNPFFSKLAATVSPLALFSIGLQMSFKGWKKWLKPMILSMSYKLLIAPILIFAVAILFQVKGPIAHISIVQAAMPTLVTAGVMAEQYRLNTTLTNLLIGYSILIGIATTFLWSLAVVSFL